MAGRAHLGRKWWPNQPRHSHGLMRSRTGVTATFSGAATMSVGLVEHARVSFSADSSMSAIGQEPVYNRTTFPNGVKRPYRIVVMDASLTQYGELTNFVLDKVNWKLNGIGTCSFKVPTDDSKIDLLYDTTTGRPYVPDREVQIWRGAELIWWGVVTRASASSDVVEFQCQEVAWYFTRRYFGKADRTNMLLNPEFEAGKATMWWHHMTTMQFLTFIPADTGNVTTSTDFKLVGTRSVGIHNPDYTGTAGISDALAESVNEFLFQEVAVYGGPNGVDVTLAAWVYVPDDAFLKSNNWATGLILARMKWVSGGSYASWDEDTFWNLSRGNPPAYNCTWYWHSGAFGTNNWRNMYTEVIEAKTTRIDENHVRDKWVRHVVTIRVPANTYEVIHARLEAPRKKSVAQGNTNNYAAAYWDACSLTYDQALENTSVNGDDQATLIKRIVQHAQDSNYDKSDVNIGVSDASCPPTGVKRYKRYRFADHRNIMEAINEFPTLYSGVDWSVYIDPSGRQFFTHFPKKGTLVPNVVFELGKNISKFRVDVDGEKTSNVIVVLGKGEDSGREEGSAVDTSTLSGNLTLEAVYNGTPGADIGTLDEQARRGLARFKNPVVIPQVTLKDSTGHLFHYLQVGNVHPLVMDRGFVQVNENYRILEITLNPNTEEIDLVLNPASLYP